MRTVVVPAEENCESVHQKVHLLVERVDSADVFQLVRRNMAHLTLFDKQIETGMYILKTLLFLALEKIPRGKKMAFILI